MEEKDIQNELASIRSLMERSSKFISLSGLSGILAGVYALAGAAAVYFIIQNEPSNIQPGALDFEALANAIAKALSIGFIAGAVLIASVTTAIVLCRRKAKRNGQSIWGVTSRTLLLHTFIPLLTGGLLILIFFYRGNAEYIVSLMLTFYGLALVSASNFTFSDVKYLGLLEITLGLIAACVPRFGLLFWAIGFGVLHIIYGSMMYLKYDR
jgi:hypothetical protein